MLVELEVDKTYSLKKVCGGKDCQKQTDETLGGCKTVGLWKTGWKSSRRHKGDVQRSQGKKSGTAYRRQISKNINKKHTPEETS